MADDILAIGDTIKKIQAAANTMKDLSDAMATNQRTIGFLQSYEDGKLEPKDILFTGDGASFIRLIHTAEFKSANQKLLDAMKAYLIEVNGIHYARIKTLNGEL